MELETGSYSQVRKRAQAAELEWQWIVARMKELWLHMVTA